jgi:hypothetical protein
MPTSADLFLARKRSGLLRFQVFDSGFCGLWGLTCDFWAENDKNGGGAKTMTVALGLWASLKALHRDEQGH